MRNEKKTNPVLAAIIVIVMIVLFLFLGISEKQKMKDGVTVDELLTESDIDGKYVQCVYETPSVKYLEYTRSLYGIIPLQKDYYYLLFNEDYTECISYKGNKEWDDLYDEDTGLPTEEFVLKGVVKNLNSDVEDQMNQFLTELRAEGISVSASTYYIDGQSERSSTLFIALAIALIVESIGIVWLKLSGDMNKIAKLLSGAGTIAILVIIVLLFIG